MILIKRKKIIFVGVVIGLIWTACGYFFTTQQLESEHPKNYRESRKEVEKQHREHGVFKIPSRTSPKAITWLPPNMAEVKGVSGGEKRRKKNKKMKRPKKKTGVLSYKVEKKKKSVGDNNEQGKLKYQIRGFGENGQPHKIDFTSLNSTMQEVYQKFYKAFGHNALVSSEISPHRNLLDVRSEACKQLVYPMDSLLKASIIIAFHNEAWSTLMRTIHSIISRTPNALLEEIILIDDASTMDHLKQPLTDYIALIQKVKLHRTTSRRGVVHARQMGADIVKDGVLIFLDSHIEVTPGWIEPLLGRIHEDDTSVVTPVMDIIDDDTFAYKEFKYDSINIGAFTWSLQFTWIGIPARIKQKLTKETDPISSPTMPGGMFAIGKKLFDKLGGFDPGMDMWGGENFEMSFKIWMCGGKLETIPCSHVGHIFRKGHVYKLGNSFNEKKNFQRVAEVWMDDYKNLYYQKTKSSKYDIGDITSRQQLRSRLKCHNFDWYINNVYPEMFVSSKALLSGEISNHLKAHGDGTEFQACIDGAAGQDKVLSIWPCHGQGGNQHWMFSTGGEIRNDDNCFDFAGVNVVLFPCHGHRGNQEWLFSTSGEITHRGTHMCLGLSHDLTKLSMEKCNQEDRQKWRWGSHKESTVDHISTSVFKPLAEDNKFNQEQPGEGEYYEETGEEEEIEFVKSKVQAQQKTTKVNIKNIVQHNNKKNDINNNEYDYYEDENEP